VGIFRLLGESHGLVTSAEKAALSFPTPKKGGTNDPFHTRSLRGKGQLHNRNGKREKGEGELASNPGQGKKEAVNMV